jgi:hypothetical protein
MTSCAMNALTVNSSAICTKRGVILESGRAKRLSPLPSKRLTVCTVYAREGAGKMKKERYRHPDICETPSFHCKV